MFENSKQILKFNEFESDNFQNLYFTDNVELCFDSINFTGFYVKGNWVDIIADINFILEDEYGNQYDLRDYADSNQFSIYNNYVVYKGDSALAIEIESGKYKLIVSDSENQYESDLFYVKNLGFGTFDEFFIIEYQKGVTLTDIGWTITLASSESVTTTIDWGDGTVQNYNLTSSELDCTHTYNDTDNQLFYIKIYSNLSKITTARFNHDLHTYATSADEAFTEIFYTDIKYLKNLQTLEIGTRCLDGISRGNVITFPFSELNNLVNVYFDRGGGDLSNFMQKFTGLSNSKSTLRLISSNLPVSAGSSDFLDELEKCTLITDLILDNNQISALPYTSGGYNWFTSLENVDIKNNNFQELPLIGYGGYYTSFQNLETYDFSRNKLVSVQNFVDTERLLELLLTNGSYYDFSQNGLVNSSVDYILEYAYTYNADIPNLFIDLSGSLGNYVNATPTRDAVRTNIATAGTGFNIGDTLTDATSGCVLTVTALTGGAGTGISELEITTGGTGIASQITSWTTSGSGSAYSVTADSYYTALVSAGATISINTV
jgi:hypothetical protein